MESLVDLNTLTLLYTAVKDQLYAAPPTFHVFVTHYKTPAYLEKCLDSLFSQVCSIPFVIHLVDDCSEMEDVTRILDKWEAKEPNRLRLSRNTTRLNKGRNLFQLLDKGTFHDQDIIGIVDGDDWLSSINAFERIVQEYRSTGCWVTYGSYMCSDGKTGNCTKPLSPVHLECEARGRGFRDAPWIFSHFFTGKAFLWKAVPRDLLIFDGALEDRAPADQVFNLAIAELASSQNISNIPDILYIYNNESPLNDCKTRLEIQEGYDAKNRLKSACIPIQRPSLDFLIILPCRGRFPLLQATIQRLKEESSSSISTEIVLVEHSEAPTYKEYAEQQGLAWIYVPMIAANTSPLGQFNRGLCFDIGFLYGSKAKYYICHDNDLLVPKDFWAKLHRNLERTKTPVLQTYSDRFVWQTSQPTSEKLLQDPSWFHNGFEVETHCTRNAPGAKGGSITISREAYLSVGGHDPHLFFGYAAEDAFFWAKLELLHSIGFSEDPRIPLVHLWHPNAANLNPFKDHMDVLFHMFRSLPHHHKQEYIFKKAAAFERFVEKSS